MWDVGLFQQSPAVLQVNPYARRVCETPLHTPPRSYAFIIYIAVVGNWAAHNRQEGRPHGSGTSSSPKRSPCVELAFLAWFTSVPTKPKLGPVVAWLRSWPCGHLGWLDHWRSARWSLSTKATVVFQDLNFEIEITAVISTKATVSCYVIACSCCSNSPNLVLISCTYPCKSTCRILAAPAWPLPLPPRCIAGSERFYVGRILQCRRLAEATALIPIWCSKGYQSNLKTDFDQVMVLPGSIFCLSRHQWTNKQTTRPTPPCISDLRNGRKHKETEFLFIFYYPEHTIDHPLYYIF